MSRALSLRQLQDRGRNRLDAGRDPGTLVYTLEDALYLNITNRCTADCVFCARSTRPVIADYNLRLTRDPTLSELRRALPPLSGYREVVFCGYGEPTLRLNVLLPLARAIRSRHVPVRLNTNGHGNLIHGRDIVPELAACVDALSVSLNAPDPASYERICRPAFGRRAFDAVLDFIRRCRTRLPAVCVTVVDTGEIDIPACRRLAEELGVPPQVRRFYNHIPEFNRLAAAQPEDRLRTRRRG